MTVIFYQIDEASEVKKTIEQLTKGVSDMVSTLQRINAPNMKAMEKYVLFSVLENDIVSIFRQICLICQCLVCLIDCRVD